MSELRRDATDDPPSQEQSHPHSQLHVMDHQEFLDFEVILNSRAAEYVVDSADAFGHEVQESAGSRTGACIVAANHKRIPTQSQVQLLLKALNTKFPIRFKCQMFPGRCGVWSVGNVYDAGCEVFFKKDGAHILHTVSGKGVGSFPRERGIYVGAF